MNLFTKLQQPEANKTLIHVGMIDAGEFSSMFLVPANRHSSVRIVGIANPNPVNATSNLAYAH